jgi:uncharacterized phage-associated protein
VILLRGFNAHRGNEMPERQKDQNIPTFMQPLIGFRSRKAAQICAYFALKSDGLIEKLKLIKLVYLSERKMLAETHHPMLFDELFSLPHGPICSSTLNGIDGEIHSEVWDDFVAHNGNIVVAMKKFARPAFDEISEAEIETLDAIWKEFGRMTASQIRNWTHENCREYTETTGRIPIAYRDVLLAVGESEAEADAVDREIGEFRRAESALGQ